MDVDTFVVFIDMRELIHDAIISKTTIKRGWHVVRVNAFARMNDKGVASIDRAIVMHVFAHLFA